MIKILFFIVFTSYFIHAQDFRSPENRKLFGDYLFCESDFLRASIEYDEYLKFYSNDTVRFKIALGFAEMENYSEAKFRFNSISSNSEYFEQSRLGYLKVLIQSEEKNLFEKIEVESISQNQLKLLNLASLLNLSELSKPEEFQTPFDKEEKGIVSGFYNQKNDPPYKSPTVAGILSAIIPGAGKIYTNQFSEGITSFILNGLFGYLAYSNFNNNHEFRGYLFAGVGAMFYSGNIYGSVASVHKYNAFVDYQLSEEVKSYLDDKNYYMDEYDFCK